MKKIDQKYLQNLQNREQALQKKMIQRREERLRANQLFIEHIKKQLNMLMEQGDRMNERNEVFQRQTKEYTKIFSKILPDMMEAEEKLKKAKLKYLQKITK